MPARASEGLGQRIDAHAAAARAQERPRARHVRARVEPRSIQAPPEGIVERLEPRARVRGPVQPLCQERRL